MIAVAVILVGAALAGLVATGTLGPYHASLPSGPTAAQRLLATEGRAVTAAEAKLAFTLPTLPGAPAPVPVGSAFRRALPRHEVIGYVPWYETSDLTPADYRDVSTIAYDGVDLAAGGALVRDDLAWAHFVGPSLPGIVAAAHAAGDRAELTVFTDTRSVVDSLARRPARSAATLAAQLVPLLAADHFDGVSIDVEGRWYADRGGFVRFVTDLVADVRATDPSARFILDTYADSANDPTGFFDLHALAPLVDRIFVMAYDMQDPSVASAGAPIASPRLGLSDVQALVEYTSVVAPSKLVLGIPFYGYDFTTRSSGAGASATTSDPPTAVTWSQIVAAGHPARWDPVSMTAWYSFRVGRQWHQTWFDDPASIALKTALASEFHLAGVGVWALGMENGDPAMLGALLGSSTALKVP